MTDLTPIIREKLEQAVGLLREHQIDCWLTFVRETSQTYDPALNLLLGTGLTWESALVVSRSGRKAALVGRFDADAVRRLEAYDDVIAYDQSIGDVLRAELDRLNPHTIALNYSLSDPAADGLTFGMYARLTRLLAGTPYIARFTSAEHIVRRLRERKSPEETSRIRRAIDITQHVYAALLARPLTGLSERQVHALAGEIAAHYGGEFAWERASNPIVNAGPDSPIGHGRPSDLVIQPGMLVHVDMGLRWEGYCADLQRMVYVRRAGEADAPEAVQRAWEACRAALEAGRAALKPGALGWQVDAAARAELTRHGYAEYMHAFGHHLGQRAHDGGGVLGPQWERYGTLPDMPVEPGSVLAIELGVMVPSYGYIGIEENVLVTDNGAEYLSTPQTELWQQ
ncbi:MAG: Xaa-Pro peptidase family protein [Anaerolineae bacterium]|nr:Xaa-Pro peptidase family protein [Thermoflexales bacterium]MDW8407970.1 Xaa-Pro peptidase family protein [Anaerolineae bacterium]